MLRQRDHLLLAGSSHFHHGGPAAFGPWPGIGVWRSDWAATTVFREAGHRPPAELPLRMAALGVWGMKRRPMGSPSRFAYRRTRVEAGMPSSHPVEHIAPDFCLDPLIGQSPGLKAPAGDGLVAKHRVSTKLRRLEPERRCHPRCHSTRLRRAEPWAAPPIRPCWSIIARCRSRCVFCRSTCNCRRSWRNDDSGFGMTLATAS